MSTQITQKWITCLQQSGCRITPARRAVVEIMAESEFALEPQRVFDLARQLHPELGLMSVYRTLETLENLGLTQRVHQRSGCHAYTAAPTGHQHLLLCVHCNRVESFSGDELDLLFDRIGIQKGYLISEHWLQLFGTCLTCTAENS